MMIVSISGIWRNVTLFWVIWSSSKSFIVVFQLIYDFYDMYSYYWPHERSSLWYNVPDTNPSTSLVAPSSLLPTSTVHITYPYVFEKTTCPVKPETTVSWTKVERAKAMKAPEIKTLQDLKQKVNFIRFFVFIKFKIFLD